MAEEPTVSMLPATGFGSMTREQMIEMALHPPKPDPERGGAGTDPFGFTMKASQLTNPTQRAQQADSQPSLLGRKAYHRKKKVECTILASTEDTEGKVPVQLEDGTKGKVLAKNLTLL